MPVQLPLPKDLDLLAVVQADDLRRDLDDAWNDRRDAVDGEDVFARIAVKSTSLKAQGK